MIDPSTKRPGRIGALAEFGNWVIEKLERTILEAQELWEHLAVVRNEALDELAEERDFHGRFIESRTRIYIGRNELQDELQGFVTGAEPKPCLVTGPSGSGKSAALARFVSVWREQHPQDAVISHFVGGRDGDAHEIMRLGSCPDWAMPFSYGCMENSLPTSRSARQRRA